MELTIIGKYGPFPKEGGACSSYLLRHGGKNVLIDCGSGCLSHLQRFAGLQEIDMILLSHLHFDHISDMLILRYALEGMTARGLNVPLPVPVYMPDSPGDAAGLIASGKVFDIHTITNDTAFKFGDMNITFKAMTHPVPSFAMRFEVEKKAFVYTGDTSMNDDIVPFSKNAELLLIDAGLLERDKKETSPHISAKEAGMIATQAKARNMIATHLYPGYYEGEVQSELATYYRNAIIARETETFTI
jgi:ribonuclease BN (tRNA processing enzyme)